MDLAQSSNQQSLESKINGVLDKYPVILQMCRFAAIGFLNTSVTFLILNLLSKLLGVEQGVYLGLISGCGFILATTQSYFWNRYWAFGQQSVGVMKNFIRLVLVGVTGVVTILLAIIGSKFTAPAYYFFILLVIFALIQLALWKSFKFTKPVGDNNPVITFYIVTLIGFLINYSLVAYVSVALHLTSNPDLNKNIAQVVATSVSLFWNFFGYKLIVFKK
jgi:putative flippase GtrA